MKKDYLKSLIHNAGNGCLDYMKFKYTHLDYDTLFIKSRKVFQRMDMSSWHLITGGSETVRVSAGTLCRSNRLRISGTP